MCKAEDTGRLTLREVDVAQRPWEARGWGVEVRHVRQWMGVWVKMFRVDEHEKLWCWDNVKEGT